ncbi:MAG: hypothetical protein J5545_01410 [Bacteroidaceae bacterium]|nr:hypothetical protein [Bacteroidaceae bacterium]
MAGYPYCAPLGLAFPLTPIAPLWGLPFRWATPIAPLWGLPFRWATLITPLWGLPFRWLPLLRPDVARRLCELCVKNKSKQLSSSKS